jgi:hypothetical protein
MEHRLRDRREPRWIDRVWRDAPGLICCCTSTPSSQAYYTFGGEVQGSPNTIVSTNRQWAGGWTTKSPLAVTREQMGRATPTAPNPLYVFGGDSSTTPFFLTRLDYYIPDAWHTDTASSGTAVFGCASCAINGLGYQWGGKNSSSVRQTQNMQLTPGAGSSTWASKAAVTTALYFAAATYIGSKGYNFAGSNSTPADTNTNYEYTPSGNTWATKTAIPSTARSGQSCFTISGVAYNVWGGALVINRNDSYVVDTWTAKAAPPTYANARQYPSHASIDASSVAWVTGGLKNTGALLTDHTEYTPDTWTTRTVLPATQAWGSSSPA